ncbi:CENP-B protein 1, partial [Claviceps sorghi]
MHRLAKPALLSALLTTAQAQQACSNTPEHHPPLSWSRCSPSGCARVAAAVTLDANWRWTHRVDGPTNCYTGNTWDRAICADSGASCAQECCVDGADYAGTYGITTTGDALRLQFVHQGPYSKNIGSRMYLMRDESTYQTFTLLGNEFSFDVDVSRLGCGLNGALYFVSMDEDGGMRRFRSNKAGARFGTGYCDSQCPRDIKFVDGVANSQNWTPSKSDANAGTGSLGACCSEIDIWEANRMATALTVHPCRNPAYHSCHGDRCGGTDSASRYAGDCDPDGCDFNPFRQGNASFFGPGPGFTVDTTRPVSVVTQFLRGRDGNLAEIKRFYVQDGKVIANAPSRVVGAAGNSLTQRYCTAQKKIFGDRDIFNAKGGMGRVTAAVSKPMVLVMSLWDD